MSLHTASGIAAHFRFRNNIVTIFILTLASLRGLHIRAFIQGPILVPGRPRATATRARYKLSSNNHYTCHSMTLTFSEFLSTPPQLDNDPSNSNTFIIGNQAGDADSIVSALALAYIDYLNHPDKPHKIPIVSIPRKDMILRRDTLLLLQLANINTNKLIYIDDEYLATTIHQNSNVNLILVDHNRFIPNNTPFASINNPTVVEIMDHHQDEGHHPEAKIRSISFHDTAVASTCTMVTERWQQHMSQPSPDLALALLGVILLDTVNASPGAGKITPRDTAAMEYLLTTTDWTLLTATNTQPFMMDDTQQLNTTRLYHDLSTAKLDPLFWKSLSLHDALRLDYKQVSGTHAGVSSVLMPMKDVLAIPNFMEQLQQAYTYHNVSLLLIMTMHMENDNTTPCRAIFICGKDHTLVHQLYQCLLQNDVLQATPMEEIISTNTTGKFHTAWLTQGNARASRKQVAPIVVDFFHSQRETQKVKEY